MRVRPLGRWVIPPSPTGAPHRAMKRGPLPSVRVKSQAQNVYLSGAHALLGIDNSDNTTLSLASRQPSHLCCNPPRRLSVNLSLPPHHSHLRVSSGTPPCHAMTACTQKPPHVPLHPSAVVPPFVNVVNLGVPRRGSPGSDEWVAACHSGRAPLSLSFFLIPPAPPRSRTPSLDFSPYSSRWIERRTWITRSISLLPPPHSRTVQIVGRLSRYCLNLHRALTSAR
jgi:hypothetical protein